MPTARRLARVFARSYGCRISPSAPAIRITQVIGLIHCMVSLHQLTKRFGEQTAVDAISFDVPSGQIVGFLGPNGAGKSTTLKMLTGMLEPTSGTASICGFDLQRDAIEVKRNVGFVPESGAVFE